jgi:hypothetical protein
MSVLVALISMGVLVVGTLVLGAVSRRPPEGPPEQGG